MQTKPSIPTISTTLFAAALLAFTPCAPAQPVLTTLHTFQGGTADGSSPFEVVLGSGGELYGVTGIGGASNDGVVFSLTPPASSGGAWTEAVYSFPYLTGPGGPTVTFGGSVLYGTTNTGGRANHGAVVSATLPLAPSSGRVLHSFTHSATGINPVAGVVLGPGGVLYGPTLHGGTYNCGVVFALTPPAAPGGAWTESVIYSLTKNDGCTQLYAPLVIDSNGVLYAATETGGRTENGRVFSLTPPSSPGGAWTKIVIYDFKGKPDGTYPAGLILGPGGLLYGAANRGGSYGSGTVFSLTPPSTQGGAWTETTLYNFTGGYDGNAPQAGVVIGPGGVLYGTTGDAPPNDSGNVFSLTPPAIPGGAWTEISLYNFTNGPDGGNPSGLVIDSNGVLYGVCITGGSAGKGTVFSLQP